MQKANDSLVVQNSLDVLHHTGTHFRPHPHLTLSSVPAAIPNCVPAAVLVLQEESSQPPSSHPFSPFCPFVPKSPQRGAGYGNAPRRDARSSCFAVSISARAEVRPVSWKQHAVLAYAIQEVDFLKYITREGLKLRLFRSIR